MKFHQFFTVILLSMCIMWLPMEALAFYSTPPVSEEYPPGACDIGDAVFGASCYGTYCDNTILYCDETNYPLARRYWTSNFSEEGYYNYRVCGANEIMSGISCSGSYCDNVSIECSQTLHWRSNCEWTAFFSEEQGYQYFGGKYASGMRCSGSHCDNRSYYVCNFF